MKLGEALLRRAQLRKERANLTRRVQQNLLVQADDKPGEDPNVLLARMEEHCSELENLTRAINKTNMQTVVPQEGVSIADLLAKRDNLIVKIRSLRDIASELVITPGAFITSFSTSAELRRVRLLNMQKIQDQITDLEQQCAALDRTVQAASWETELLSL